MDYGQCLKRLREPVLANNGQTNWRVVQIYPMAGLIIVHFSCPVCSPLSLFSIQAILWRLRQRLRLRSYFHGRNARRQTHRQTDRQYLASQIFQRSEKRRTQKQTQNAQTLVWKLGFKAGSQGNLIRFRLQRWRGFLQGVPKPVCVDFTVTFNHFGLFRPPF